MALIPASSSRRLALLLFSAIMIATFTVLAFMHFVSQRSLMKQEQSLISEVEEDLLFSYRDGGPQGLAEAIQERLATDPHTDTVMAYYEPGGSLIVGNLARPIGDTQGVEETATLRRSGDPTDLPAIVETLELPDRSQLVVGRVRAGVLALRAADWSGLLLALAVSIPLALTLAFVLVRLIERRARAIATAADRVGRGDLGTRIEVGGGDDAFDRLAAALNTMFARIEALVSELRTVTDGLAHDLRSPITRLLVAVDEASRVTDNPQALAALERASREATALETILTTALQITRAEAGIGRDRFEPLDLGALLNELAELYAPVAEEEGFSLVVQAEADVRILGNRQLVAQAIANLIDNAMHYAGGGDRIAISAQADAGGMALVTVEDNGQGIAEDQRAEALRRFGRLDPSRHQSGSGLGLSLVQATADLHGGMLELDSAEPGLIVRLYLGAVTPARGPGR